MIQLFHFLTDLATNPNKQQAFFNNSSAFMDMTGLSEADKAVITSGDHAQITALFAKELAQPAFAVFDPGPDPLPDPDPAPFSYAQ